MPAVGLGTWQSKPGEVQAAVSCALQSGYRLVDCAYCYGNEDEVGQGLRLAFDAGVERDRVFVMTKVWATYNTRVAEGLEKSLQSLGLGYVDLFLIHWPILLNPQGNHDKFPTLPDGSRDVVRGWDHVEAWKQMEALLGTGKVKAIGVCNQAISGGAAASLHRRARRQPSREPSRPTAAGDCGSLQGQGHPRRGLQPVWEHGQPLDERRARGQDCGKEGCQPRHSPAELPCRPRKHRSGQVGHAGTYQGQPARRRPRRCRQKAPRRLLGPSCQQRRAQALRVPSL